MSHANLADRELVNWARYVNSGPNPHPSLLGLSMVVFFDADRPPEPIHEDHAKEVQKIFDASFHIERKVMQAEYVSPTQYKRHLDMSSAARVLGITLAAYETILASVRRRVERAFA